MKKKYSNAFACLLLGICIIVMTTVVGCAESFMNNNDVPGERKNFEELRVVNWNVQTFFDAINNGLEYGEFLSSKNWGEKSYIERLERLKSSIKIFDADILVMEEIENEGVLHDISNFLAGEWNQNKVYRYACFAKDEGSSIGCGILSRYPLERLTLHSVDVHGETSVPKMRPIMQLAVLKGGKKLILFVNHWKSMSGGEMETNVWRLRQESVLSRRVSIEKNKGNAILMCGDFNRDICDFSEGTERGMVLLRRLPSDDCTDGIEVRSPWFDAKRNLINPGSYYFDGEWSRIDNFFVAGGADILDFGPLTDGPWCDEESSIPIRYQIWNGNGYSDHLPVFCRVRF